MRCERGAAVARLGLRELPEAERLELDAHVAACEECRASYRSLIAFEKALVGEVDGPSDAARRAMWREISDASAPRAWISWRFALPALVAATAALLMFLLIKPQRVPGREDMHARVTPALENDNHARGLRAPENDIHARGLRAPENDNHARGLRAPENDIHARGLRAPENDIRARGLRAPESDRHDRVALTPKGALPHSLDSRGLAIVEHVQLANGESFGAGSLRIEGVREASLLIEEFGGELALTILDGSAAIDFAATEEAARLLIVAGGRRIETLGGRFEVLVEDDGVRVEEINEAPAVVAVVPEKIRETAPAPPKQQAPAPAPSALELMNTADTHRLRGELEPAAALYANVAAHAEGHVYAEEAMLREARILRELGRIDEARSVLKRARERFPHGELEPERAREEKK